MSADTMVDPTPPFGMTASIVYKITVLCVDCCCARTIMYVVIVASFPGPCHGQGPGTLRQLCSMHGFKVHSLLLAVQSVDFTHACTDKLYTKLKLIKYYNIII